MVIEFWVSGFFCCCVVVLWFDQVSSYLFKLHECFCVFAIWKNKITPNILIINESQFLRKLGMYQEALEHLQMKILFETLTLFQGKGQVNLEISVSHPCFSEKQFLAVNPFHVYR